MGVLQIPGQPAVEADAIRAIHAQATEDTSATRATQVTTLAASPVAAGSSRQSK